MVNLLAPGNCKRGSTVFGITGHHPRDRMGHGNRRLAICTPAVILVRLIVTTTAEAPLHVVKRRLTHI